MDKKILMRFDRVQANTNLGHVSRLNFSIEDGTVTLVKCTHPELIYQLFTGEVVPESGTITLGGVNITARNRNERRVSEIVFPTTTDTAEKLLRSVLCDNIPTLTVLEENKAQCDNKIKELKKQIRSAKGEEKAALQETLKRLKIDSTAFMLKISRRKTELSLNLKTAKALLNSLRRDNLAKAPNAIELMEAKLFSANYEYALFAHKALPDALVEQRIKYVCKKLDLPDMLDCKDMDSALAMAYIKAPMLSVYFGSASTEDISKCRQFTEKTGVATVIVTDSQELVSDCSIVRIDNYCFE